MLVVFLQQRNTTHPRIRSLGYTPRNPSPMVSRDLPKPSHHPPLERRNMIWPLDYRYRFDNWPHGKPISGYCDWCDSMQTQVVAMHEINDNSDLITIVCAKHLLTQPWHHQ
jgi:hypothetical protein